MSRIPGFVGAVIEHRPRVVRRVYRSQDCPHLVRVFFSLSGRHNPMSDYFRGNLPGSELQIHCWMDTSLMELTKLIQGHLPEARVKGTSFYFSFVFMDNRGRRYRMKDVGSTCYGQTGPHDSKTLFNCRFKIGDFLDVAIEIPPPKHEASTYHRKF
ncbi:hypothetical protein JTE90_016843 [Oedothorax gibbosus]|uniref:18 kDa Sin3-associated polypeptide n=1 Tax=Oedothorax gibbosus TaxID=931172 RepID=A0AAV6VXN3_9ARAC|nr:hypothetical protein JTE90_016843 [Oedothorax gibbosus]